MKKLRPLQGMRVVSRMQFYTLCFLAVIASREFLIFGGGPLTTFLGRGANQILQASSKLGLGFALICKEEICDHSMIGRGGQKLGRVAHKAFVESAKVELVEE